MNKSLTELQIIEHILQKYRYDPETGVFTRKRARGYEPAGAIVGVRGSNGVLRLSVAGTSYRQCDLVWLLTYGRWPRGTLRHRNGNLDDNRYTNLTEEEN